MTETEYSAGELRAAIRSYLRTVGEEEGVTFTQHIQNPHHRDIIQRIEREQNDEFRATNDALGSVRAEGLEPSQRVLDLVEKVKTNEITINEFGTQVRSLYARVK